MLLSMTGFASKSVRLDLSSIGKASIAIEMKSINSRFFEVVAKLPSALNSIEIKMMGRLQKKLRRGRVYVTIRLAEDNEAFEEIVPSLKIAQGYIDAARMVSQACNISGELSMKYLFQLPNIFVTKKSSLTEEQEERILEEIDGVADLLTQTRRDEGKNLSNDIKKRFAICDEKIDQIAQFSEVMITAIKASINAKLELVEKGDEVAKIQLDDLYGTLNKADIHEEVTRFKSHLHSIDDLFINSPDDDKGKRLDFVLQELLRETNTIMAKCSNFEISTVGVDIKVELEKAREQAQNIV